MRERLPRSCSLWRPPHRWCRRMRREAGGHTERRPKTISLLAEEGWLRRRRRRGGAKREPDRAKPQEKTGVPHRFAELTTPAPPLLLNCRATPPLRRGGLVSPP